MYSPADLRLKVGRYYNYCRTYTIRRPSSQKEQQDMSDSNPPSETNPPTPEELKRAMKAFKKRLKLTRLDDESRLGVGAMTGGNASGVVAIMPPNQYPKSVWDELVKQGRLRNTGFGLYELVKV
jgi:hypothetical protein